MKISNKELFFEVAKAVVVMRFEFKFEDFWVGAFWRVFLDEIDIWVCLIPCFPLHITICRNFEKTFDIDHDFVAPMNDDDEWWRGVSPIPTSVVITEGKIDLPGELMEPRHKKIRLANFANLNADSVVSIPATPKSDHDEDSES